MTDKVNGHSGEQMRTTLFIAALIFLASCNQSETGSVSRGNINAEAPYLWTSSFPKQLQISTAFSGTEVTNLRAVGDAWSTAVENKKTFFNYTTGATEKTVGLGSTSALNDGVLGIYKANTWPYPDYPDALAVTQIFAFRYNVGSSSEYVDIQEADILMNYQNFMFDGPAGSYDFRTVMLHELGHFLGLSHKSKFSDRNSSVMYPSIYNYELKRAPKAIDAGDMAAKYSITLSGGGSPALAGNTVKYEPHGPGTAVKIILELRASGDCIHYEDGAETLRHRID
jgi:predicted Zn-dependent protease